MSRHIPAGNIMHIIISRVEKTWKRLDYFVRAAELRGRPGARGRGGAVPQGVPDRPMSNRVQVYPSLERPSDFFLEGEPKKFRPKNPAQKILAKILKPGYTLKTAEPCTRRGRRIT